MGARQITRLPPGAFDLGKTEPTSIRGVAGSVGFRPAEASLSNYAGSFTNALAGETIAGLAITGQFKPQAAGVTLRDSLILLGDNPAGPSTGTVAGGDAVVKTWYAIDATALPGTLNLRCEYVTIRPSNPTVDSYGINGRCWDLYRCHLGGVVDGLNPAGAGTQVASSQWFAGRGCLIEDLRSYSPDPRQSDNTAHSDGCQAQGKMATVSPFSGVNGLVGCSIRGGRTSAILIQQQSGTYGFLQIDDSWLYGHPTEGSTINIADGGTAIPDLWVRRNRISNTGRNGVFWFLLGAATYNQGTAWRDAHCTGNVVLETGVAINPSNGG